MSEELIRIDQIGGLHCLSIGGLHCHTIGGLHCHATSGLRCGGLPMAAAIGNRPWPL